MTGYMPLAWQTRLFGQLETGEIPAALDLPTGLGKTSVMAIWYLARRAGAGLPRRLVYVVDRRAVVDQATEEAEKIRDWAKTQGDDLPISTLRGQYADNREWLTDPASGSIIVGTVAMVGSRLLFEGYGASRRMRPYMAGILGVDTLVVLDESHLVPPFEALLKQIESAETLRAKEAADSDLFPPFRLLPLSATGKHDADGEEPFKLDEEDQEHPVVRQRLNAEKRLQFEDLDGKTLDVRLAEEAWKLCGEGGRPARILVYCNSREVADSTKSAIENKAKGNKKEDIPAIDIETELFVGARRVYEREQAKERLDKLGFFSKEDKPPPDKPTFVVATSAGEVGVDLDADHMVMDLVPFERVVQRLGRVNRLGEKDSQVVVIHGDKPVPKKKDAPTEAEERELIAWNAGRLLKKLPRHEDKIFDASPAALTGLKERHGEAVKAASTPDPLYPELTRALVDAWSMTSLKDHTGRPEIQPWLRGWVEEEPQTTLVWRTHLPVRTKGDDTTPEEIDAFFAAARPHLTEKLETETRRIHRWLLDRAEKLAATFEKERLAAEKVEPESDDSKAPPLGVQKVVAILLGRRGEKAKVYTADYLARAKRTKRDKDALERALQGRTLVVDARMGGWSKDGLFNPKAPDIVPCADSENGWLTPQRDEPDKEAPLVAFRVQRVRVKRGGEDEAAGKERAPEEQKGSRAEPAENEKWRVFHTFDTERDGEGKPEYQLVVEKWRDADTTENARSIMRVVQSLEDHEKCAEGKAENIVRALGLKERAADIANAIITAALLHDEGKRAAVWQRAFNAPREGGPYAKTKGPFRNTLHGYRHEFGSLLEIEKGNEKRIVLEAFSEETQDLILHLIAAHHGHARPVIATNGCDQAPPSALEAKAREVALRFARLQERFGPWGLAWLEALMRAADQQASRELENQENATGDGDG